MKKLNFLATLTSAVMLFSTSASAGIIYSQVNQNWVSGTPMFFDVNNDSTIDFRFNFQFTDQRWGDGRDISSNLFVSGQNSALVSTGGPLSINSEIDELISYTNSNYLANFNYKLRDESCYFNGNGYTCRPKEEYWRYNGTWNSDGRTRSGFLGFSFFDGTGTSYGWFDLTVSFDGLGKVNAFAYETDYDTSILAGQTFREVPVEQDPDSVSEPASLTLMAFGALGMLALRRRKKQA